MIAALRPMPSGSSGAATPPAAPPAGGQGALKTSEIEVRVDPQEEWKQMYHEAWRVERDWFYDRNLHGLDVKAAEKKYEPYLRNVASREDLTYLFQEMLGNMTVSHMGTGGSACRPVCWAPITRWRMADTASASCITARIGIRSFAHR